MVTTYAKGGGRHRYLGDCLRKRPYCARRPCRLAWLSAHSRRVSPASGLSRSG